MQTHKLIMQQNLVAQKVQARAQYETLEQQRKGRLANAAVSGISDLMKSKKSDQLTSSLMMQ
jgi:ribosomal protein S21